MTVKVRKHFCPTWMLSNFKLCAAERKNKLSVSLQGKEVSQESVKQFYETWISRQNTLSSEEGLDALSPPPTPPPVLSSHHVYVKLKSQASKMSAGSSFDR